MKKNPKHGPILQKILELNKKLWNHIYYRYYFSATPYRNDGSDLSLKGIIGDIIYKYDAVKAIEDGFLTPPYFFIYKFNHKFQRDKNYSEEYDRCLVKNKERNKFIAEICNLIKSKDNSQILVLLERIEHGDILHSMIPDSHWIHGGTKDNHKVIEKFNQGKIRFLIASTVVGEGIDLPKVKVLVIAGAGKAKSQIYQKIGRVLRIAENKNKAIIVDFLDMNTKWLMRHIEQRMRYYKTYKTEVKIIE